MLRFFTIFVMPVLFSAAGWGAHTCIPCHQKQVTGFASTGMGRSAAIHASLPDGQVRNGASKIRNNSGTLNISAGEESFPVSYVIGSGNEGISFLVNSNQHLFQAPPSWYSRRKQYDVSPGFEQDTYLTFDRAISSDCLFCHTGKATPVEGTINRYETPAIPDIAISCDRCHGSAEAHLKSPQRGNIVNPQKLEHTRRDSVCEQCHLGGEARILNPGKKFEDFRPGMLLEEVFSVYLSENSRQDALKVVGHAEGLAASACLQKSQGKLGCASCHDVHQTPADQKQWHRQKCIQCHDEQTLTKHPADKKDCAGCHMPRRQSFDGSHTAFTDHRIQIPGKKSFSSPVLSEKLIAWRPSPQPLTDRNLGLAYISTGEKEASAAKLNEGLRLLLQEQRKFPKDPAVQNAIGAVLMKKNATSDAARFFQRAIDAEPNRGANHLNLAAAFLAMNRKDDARRSANEALRLDPGIEEAYRLLILIDPEKRASITAQFLKALPGRRLIFP